MKKSINDIQSIVAHNQNARTHFGPRITFLAIMVFNIYFFGIISKAKCQATIVTCFQGDRQDI